MSQFLETFYEESFEGLDIMESGLLELNTGAADPELINSIFRAAHSIKGGSATFGLDEVALFTHVLETLLDELRDGRREVSQQGVDLMLQSVDCLKEMLTALREGSEVDKERAEIVHRQLEDLLHNDSSAGGSVSKGLAEVAKVEEEQASISGWEIRFHPHPHMLKTGNDPVRMFRELALLGELTTTVDIEGLVPLSDMDPEESYLSWELELKTEASREQIEEIFEWVEDDCDLEVIAIEEPALKSQTVAGSILEGSTKNESKVAAATDESSTAKPATRVASSSGAESSSIRVNTTKIDALINMVGELVITQSMLGQLGDNLAEESMGNVNIERLVDGLSELERNTRELQESVMRIRMLPISFTFNRFPRLVHDLSQKMDKKIELKMSGEQTELDKGVLEKIGDPLVHLVRNSLDHGIESPEKRIECGKPETGTVHLNAFHQGGNIVIEIIDDGAGLNKEKIKQKAIERGLIGANDVLSDEKIHDLILEPGFSTADTVSDISGRGVGMDVVKRNITDLGGSVDVTSEEGEGSTFTIRLPLTLAILDGQLVRVGDEVYIVPLVSIIESLQAKKEMTSSVNVKAEFYKLREEYIPIIRVSDVFSINTGVNELSEGLLVIVEGDGQKAGLFVDDLLGQQQVVIKSLESNYQRVTGVSGATILGDGTVALILDVPGLVRLHKNPQQPDIRLVNGDCKDVA